MIQGAPPTPEVTPELLRQNPLPEHHQGEGKEGRGRVLVVGGSSEVAGAALLAGLAVLRSGAGKLQIATVASAAPQLAMAIPEARVVSLAETSQGGIAAKAAEGLKTRMAHCAAVLVGPGMMDKDACADLVAALLDDADGPPLVLDAGALTGLADQAERLKARRRRAIITPHGGEIAACLGLKSDVVNADPVAVARQAAERLGVIVALKGGETHIATPDGQTWTSLHGNIGLATSGSGDTLAGLVAGLLARGAEPLDAARWGVFVHAEAGDRLARKHGPVGYLARELIDLFPRILADLAGQSPIVRSAP